MGHKKNIGLKWITKNSVLLNNNLKLQFTMNREKWVGKSGSQKMGHKK